MEPRKSKIMCEIPKSEELKTKDKKRVRQIKTWGCAKDFFLKRGKSFAFH
jgi:hypothetical protein